MTNDTESVYDPAAIFIDTLMGAFQLYQQVEQVRQMGGIPSDQMREAMRSSLDELTKAVQAMVEKKGPKLVTPD